MNILIVAILVVAGVALLVAELYLLPGFGIAGISGLGSMAAAVALAYIKLTDVYPLAGHITLLVCVVATVVVMWLLFKSKAIDKMALDTQIDSQVGLAEPGKKMEEMINDK